MIETFWEVSIMVSTSFGIWNQVSRFDQTDLGTSREVSGILSAPDSAVLKMACRFQEKGLGCAVPRARPPNHEAAPPARPGRRRSWMGYAHPELYVGDPDALPMPSRERALAR